eukprot:TRINITY_DN65167_c0_g1_i1.p1 TRINITY_DN65167_c0_g1~~TRINITY_DN65167_c0_g1_i1.p1  ORF type:complete len:150 (+),score=14.74 TRINITY_DN65167_c0_g1_i1:88-537(+)
MAQEVLTEDQQQTFQESFNLFDRTGSGAIEPPTLPNLLRAVGLNPTNDHLSQLFQKYPSEKAIDYDTFLQIYHWLKPQCQTNMQDFIQAFQVFDKEGNGYISAGELRYVLTSLGDRLEESEVDDLLKAAKVDSNGLVQYQEFVKFICSQ